MALQITVFVSNDSNFGISCVIGVCDCLKDVSCQRDYFRSMPLLGQLTGIQNIFWCLDPVYVYHSHLSMCVCVRKQARRSLYSLLVINQPKQDQWRLSTKLDVKGLQSRLFSDLSVQSHLATPELHDPLYRSNNGLQRWTAESSWYKDREQTLKQSRRHNIKSLGFLFVVPSWWNIPS